MKPILFCLFAATTLATRAVAQEPETLVKGDHSGGFGGPTLQVTSINGEAGVLMGGRGGWIIDHQFVIGGAGRGLVGTGIEAPIMGPGGVPLYVTFGYGGLELQYIHQPLKLLHTTFQLLIGGGDVAYRRDGTTMQNNSLFVAEPGVLATLNIARKVHFTFGATYRYVSGVDIPGLSNADLRAASVLLGLEFGSF